MRLRMVGEAMSEELLGVAVMQMEKDLIMANSKIEKLEADLTTVANFYFRDSTTTMEVLDVEEILEAHKEE